MRGMNRGELFMGLGTLCVRQPGVKGYQPA
jgi:hypothetical protein